MNFGEHMWKHLMKDVSTECSGHAVLVVVAQGSKARRKILEYSKRESWNAFLRHGYRLIQDDNTKFAERVSKAADKVHSEISGINQRIALE